MTSRLRARPTRLALGAMVLLAGVAAGTTGAHATDDLDSGGTPSLGPTLFCEGKEVTVDLRLGQSPTNGPDVIRGSSKAETIKGFGGNDTICGLDGNDNIDGGTGNDVMNGGLGDDTVSYETNQSGVVVTLGSNQPQNTGKFTGIDTIKQVENLFGGSGDDKLTGNSQDNTLAGLSGDDTLRGQAGADFLNGGTDFDFCLGNLNDDDDDITTGCEGSGN